MKQKGRTSDHIHFPRHSARISRRFDNANGDLLGRAVVISIINYLADVADAAEEVRLPKGHRDRARLENERRKMCESVVRGANDLTALFNSVKGERKYTDPARMFTCAIMRTLANPTI
ncbi:hypothetical protein NM208_g12375 [Fusarium decemcellulare]|uniref:Uncharacterized protein n=1 Tax=Fusarium decemcellulare TaxID=57161 RepID=A0ACC1RPJ0_9HYPO|nr:hypothetical protein NM208_g12375 [Fusarium decemcellulare]